MDFAAIAREQYKANALATVNLRAGAWLMDFFIRVVLSFVVYSLLKEGLWLQLGSEILDDALNKLPFGLEEEAYESFMEVATTLAMYLCFAVVSVLYGLIEFFTNQSIGKMINSIYLVEQTGKRPSLLQRLNRYLMVNGVAIFMLLSCYWSTDMIYVAIFYFNLFAVSGLACGRTNKIAIHDLITRTRVLSANPNT